MQLQGNAGMFQTSHLKRHKIMKIHRTLPKNEGFFGYYAALIPTLFKVGFLSQIFSAIIETYILYVILYPKFAGAIDNPTGAAILAALLLVALLESGLRVGSTYAARAILHRRFSGLDLVMTFCIFALSVSLLICSLTLHIEGSKEAVEISAGEVKRETTGQIDSTGQKEVAGLLRSYSQDSATVSATYAGQIKAVKRANAARVSAYVSSKGATGAGAAAIRAEGAEKIAALETERAARFASLLDGKNANLQTVQGRKNSAVDEITERNRKKEAAQESKVGKYSSYLSVFSVLTVVFFLLTIILHEVYQKGSGINQVAIPTQYHFDPGVWSKFANAVSDKFQYHARAAIEVIERSTPQPAAPLEPHPLYEWDGLTPGRLAAGAIRRPPGKVTNAGTGNQGPTYRVPINPTEPADPAATQQAQDLKLTWVQVNDWFWEGKNKFGYVGEIVGKDGAFNGSLLFQNGGQTAQIERGGTGDLGLTQIVLDALISRHFFGDAASFADALKNVTDGSEQRAHADTRARNNATMSGGFPGKCKHCGADFNGIVKWQKFCSETCKLDHHEAKHGKRFDSKQFRKPGGKAGA